MRAFCAAVLFFILTALHSPAGEEHGSFPLKSVWVQVGNQVKDVDDLMIQKMKAHGISRVVLIPSALAERGYLEKLPEIAKRCQRNGIIFSFGTMTFKDPFLRAYWEKYPERRRVGPGGMAQDKSPWKYQLCPQNPENQNYVASLLVREAQRCGADDIHIDYEMDFCWCPYCKSEMARLYGVDIGTADRADLRWRIWRSQRTRSFFGLLRRKINEAYLSATVSLTAPILEDDGFSAYGTSIRYEDLSQYVDLFEPMIYIYGNQPPQMSGRQFSAIRRRLAGKLVSAGLTLFDEPSRSNKGEERLRAELAAVREAGGRLLTVFEIRYIGVENARLLLPEGW